MKSLLIGEYRKGKLQDTIYELAAFNDTIDSDAAIFLVGNKNELPQLQGEIHLADSEKYGEYHPEYHKQLLLQVIDKVKPDLVVFSHSSYGWDLAPRIALALKAAQVSEVVGYDNGAFVVPACNAKLHRLVKPQTDITVITLQVGAFQSAGEPSGSPTVTQVEIDAPPSSFVFEGYEAGAKAGVELSKAEIIVSAGRGVGSKEGIEQINHLAQKLGGEVGASRPVVDSDWLPHDHQIGSTGQVVSPKLYIACGISGAIQHLIGMKKSEFIVAINTDSEAPIGEVADVLVVADLKQFIPVLLEKL